MKNYKNVLFSLILVFGFSFSGAMAMDSIKITEELKSFDGVISKTLYKGSVGEEVSKLQDFLIDTEYLKVETPTGYFGTQTETAVKNFQDQIGLKPDGVVGPQTRNFFNLVPTVSILKEVTKEVVVNTDTDKEEVVLKDCGVGDKFSALTGKSCDDTQVKVLPDGCKEGYKYSMTTGMRCDGVEETTKVVIDENYTLQDDEDETDREDEVIIIDDTRVLNKIMFWYGKVNQHTDVIGNWQTDPDGVSGAGDYAQFGDEGYGDRKLEYCQKFFPNTKSVAPYELETISTWKERGNVNNWTSTKLSYLCSE